MATGTTLVTVTQALVALLAPRPALDGVQVAFCMPTNEPGNELADEAIWFGGASTPEVEQAAFGGAIKADHERYDLEAVIQVALRDGRTEETCAVRAAALLAELQQVLASNKTAGGAMRIQLAGWEHTIGPLGDSGNRGSRYDLTISVLAELKP